MPILADYHMHTQYSPDSDSTVTQLIEYAKKQNLLEICTTDHFDLKRPPIPGGIPDNTPDFASLRDDIERGTAGHPGLKIKVGWEYSLHTENHEELAQAIEEFKPNFIIASMHYCKDISLRGMLNRKYSSDEIHDRYLNSMLDSVKITDKFSVLGHFDFVERYGDRQPINLVKYKELIHEVLKTLVEKNRGLEINTAFLAFNSPHPHPGPDVLKLYKELGGEIITVGSDAHQPEHIGYGFDMVADYAQSLGFEHYCTFDKYDEPKFHKFDSVTL